ncbi:CRISPR-associated helicase Cas3' [Brotaphodocola sp.]|uniref:CRISPR-associated helicase Cas3' n=1 Tax=Brotaphodocola sp. TaxID=3073577 RepID=UPI003D7CA34B
MASGEKSVFIVDKGGIVLAITETQISGILEQITKLIDKPENFDAHIRENKETGKIERESLLEHIERTVKYFARIWNEKELDHFFDRMIEVWYEDGCCSEVEKKFWKELILAIPAFHDIGKINPAFQVEKMKNHRGENKKSEYCFEDVASNHSVVSSMIYMDYFQKELKGKIRNKEIENKAFFRLLIVLHAYIIDRHHSNLTDFESFLHSAQFERGSSVLDIIENKECKTYLGPCEISKNDIDKGFRKPCSKMWEEKWNSSKEKSIAEYVYVRMLYSLLIASDYYATAEFEQGVEMQQLGNVEEISGWIDAYESTERIKGIRKYQSEEYPKTRQDFERVTNMNELRTEMFLDAETELKKHLDEKIFYLEAPTGSGKSNTAINLSFQLMKTDSHLKKLYYIYPFNTLVEQNKETLQEIFKGNKEILESIAVVNALTPIKVDLSKGDKGEEESGGEENFGSYYQRALLDRQFLNYPMILSTHVSLFDTIFGARKESAMAFHQLVNSVIVLDEIQSYRYKIWGEIIYFLKGIANLLNVRILIMSATLPNLDLITEQMRDAVILNRNREKYYQHPCFKNRAVISYELLEKRKVGREEREEQREAFIERLLNHVEASAQSRKKVLVEFIKKKTAFEFYRSLRERLDVSCECEVEYMSGDDSVSERARILTCVKENMSGIVLVATQVIEAGVDLDMDIGYKDISKMDSEEQFIGRINRSFAKHGKVYFFDLDDEKVIYGNEDVRTAAELTIQNSEIREYFEQKQFDCYYKKVLECLKRNVSQNVGQDGLDAFFKESVMKLYWRKIEERMRLISEDAWSVSVYLARDLERVDGTVISGSKLWGKYAELLQDCSMDYAEKKTRLSELMSQMNEFIYKTNQNTSIEKYNDKIGELFYIEDSDVYFEDGKLNRERLQGKDQEFVDFI